MEVSSPPGNPSTRSGRTAAGGEGAQFAEGATFADQDALDAAINVTPLPDMPLKPVLDALKNGMPPDQILIDMAEWYPKLDDAALTELLARGIFVAEVWGRLNAGD